MRFLGNIEAKTDQKGRVFLPAAFRKELQREGQETMVLRKDAYQRCLVLYPESVWNEQLTMLRQRLNRWNPQEQQVFRQFISEAEQVVLDGNGRFLISRRSLDFAGITGAVSFIGMDDTIEIWSAANTAEPFMPMEEFGAKLAELMTTPTPTLPEGRE